jgi:microcystin-dependent protein
MTQPFIGQVQVFGFQFAPINWAFCNGQVIPISQNTALFSILGTTYGGNGTSNFALPNLQGLGVLHQGQGSGLSNYVEGETVGSADVTLTLNQTPQHTHQVFATAGTQADLAPTGGGWFGQDATPLPARVYTVDAGNAFFALTAIQGTGGGQPHNNQQPFLTMNFCIAMFGIFPSRN